MYQDKITSWFQENRQNMIDDICRLIEIESVSGEPADGKPFGVGPARALECALSIAENMGFATKNYGCYVGVVDMNDLTHQLDICRLRSKGLGQRKRRSAEYLPNCA